MLTADALLESIPQLTVYAKALADKNYRDLLQDTLEHAWRKRQLFSPDRPEPPVRWLTIIMRNKHLASKERYRRKSVDTINVTNLLTLIPETVPDAFETVCAAQAFANLSPQEKEICLRMAFGETPRQMHNRFHLSVRTVWNRVLTIRKKLEQFL